MTQSGNVCIRPRTWRRMRDWACEYC